MRVRPTTGGPGMMDHRKRLGVALSWVRSDSPRSCMSSIIRRRNGVIKTSYRLTRSDRRDDHTVVDSGQVASKRSGSGSRFRLRVALRSTSSCADYCTAKYDQLAPQAWFPWPSARCPAGRGRLPAGARRRGDAARHGAALGPCGARGARLSARLWLVVRCG